MAHRLRFADDNGLTLTELMATIAILAVVMTLITGTFISLQQTVTASARRFDDLGQARLAMDVTTKDLRTAIRLTPDGSPFTVATASDVEFYANLDTENASDDPKRVRLSIVDGELIEQTTDGEIVDVPDPDDPDATVPQWQAIGATQERVVARGLTTADLFTYFGETPAAFTFDGSGSLSADDQRAVRQVRITVRVKATTRPDVAPTVIENQVRMPNLYYVNPEEEEA